MGCLLIFIHQDSLGQGKKRDHDKNFHSKETVEKYRYKSVHQVKKINLPGIENRKAKNIILMIGDGMGTSQIHAGMIANKGELYLGQFPYAGFITTHSANELITDSAAGATAFATGEKTDNGMLGVNPDNEPLQTIMEIAEYKGLGTGLVVTSTVTHATPAAFAAHQFSRHYYEQIASDLIRNDIDVFIGGGRSHFTDRLDRLNLLEILKERNYTVVDTVIDLEAAHGDKIAGLLYYDNPPSILDGRGDMLLKATKKSIETLGRNDNGFMMMIESSQIDWGNHQNNILYQTEEMLDFDIIIGHVLEFAAMDGETLVIVTSDHETGGLAISGGNLKKGIVHGDYTTNGHTGVMVPVFAYGPSADLFTGIFDNTEIYDKMIEAFDWNGSKP
ncbi:MAG: alkaline phosphatase [Cyclobacteriaceae bacterium]|nr:alkaline phosphatase [Cyclobacteriaceae bacterium]